MKIIITFQLFSSFFLKKHATGMLFCDKRRKKPQNLSQNEIIMYLCSYGLPRVGKDITVTHWSEDGREKWQTTLKWNGHGFDK